MTDADQKVELRCPECKCKVRPSHRMEAATLALLRSCRCGAKWSVIITPMHTKKDDEGNLVLATHYVKWTDSEGAEVPVSTDENVKGRVWED